MGDEAYLLDIIKGQFRFKERRDLTSTEHEYDTHLYQNPQIRNWEVVVNTGWVWKDIDADWALGWDLTVDVGHVEGIWIFVIWMIDV